MDEKPNFAYRELTLYVLFGNERTSDSDSSDIGGHYEASSDGNRSGLLLLRFTRSHVG